MALSRGQKWLLAILAGGGIFVHGIVGSLTPPFYPGLAESKGATPPQYNFVFGIYELAALLGAPLSSILVKYMRPKYIFVLGDLISGIAVILFGLIDYLSSTTLFLVASYILRFVEGIGSVLGSTSIISIFMVTFSERMSTASVSVEVLISIGAALGPLVGGVLFQLGGFFVPFGVFGLIQLLHALNSWIFLPVEKNTNQPEKAENECDKKNTGKLSFVNVIKHPTIFFSYLSLMFAVASFCMVITTLASHLKSIGASQSEITWVFSITSLVYMLLQLAAGPLCDWLTFPTVLPLIGSPLNMLCLIFLGPSRLIPTSVLSPSVASVCLSFVMHEIGGALILGSCFRRAHNAMVRQGFSKDEQNTMVLSGLLIACCHLGYMLGSMFTSILLDILAYRDTALCFVVPNLLGFFVDVALLCNDVKEVRKSREMATEVEAGCKL